MTSAGLSARPEFSAAAKSRAALQKVSEHVSEHWPARAFFGVLLAAIALAATFAGGYWFIAILAMGAVAAAREWHRMADGRVHAFERWITSVTIVAALLLLAGTHKGLWGFAILATGAFLAAGIGFRNGGSAAWHGFAALYIGVPALCLAALRMKTAHGAWVILGLFVVIWTADTSALLLGRAIGGPKFVPSLSPNKTWAGTLGGLVVPALAFGGYVAVMGGDWIRAGFLGMVLALAAEAGDLFESWMKRRAGRKNSGSLIPGHGGVLDRVDSTLFVAPLAAVLVFVLGLDLLFGAHP